jgi:hypothetical protein
MLPFCLLQLHQNESPCIIISPPTKTKTKQIQTMSSKHRKRHRKEESKRNNKAPRSKRGETAPTAADRLAEEEREGTVAELK